MEKFTINFQGKDYPVEVNIEKLPDETRYEVRHTSDVLEPYIDKTFYITRKQNDPDAQYKWPLLSGGTAECEFKSAVAKKIREFEGNA